MSDLIHDYIKAVLSDDFELGLRLMDHALKLEPGNSDVWMNRGVVLKDLGREKEALLSYKKSLQFNEGNADAWFNMGNLYVMMDDIEEAKYCFTKAVEIVPNDTEARAALQECLEKLGR